eukprot:gnl/TRDRNA2_/TRDRNA2_192751_c0_seq1.p1 gnl/TRDRNA2_/TRDRNA2_192751_c0~~gnl/TRDRNA2_/TRDRNA2_192751_c0_seq1.p1  ORF type:complete len:312 (-),score=40.57 gnl/TRDRNA2_/TRDRNA2_192751_c0_seq1:106-1041(-)
MPDAEPLPPAAALGCVVGLTLVQGPFPAVVEYASAVFLVLMHLFLGRPPLSSPPLVCALGPALTRWPQAVPKKLLRLIPRLLLAPGAFGTGCAKALEALIIAVLFPKLLVAGSAPSTPVLVFVVVGTLATFAILQMWARLYEPTFATMGELRRTVAPAKSDSLGSRMTPLLRAAALAAVNAVVEEVPFRGLLLRELEASGFHPYSANLCQAVSFGTLHWRGIPSGWAGVGLTTIYGAVMGWLAQTTGGLATPVSAHAFADLFIFAVLVGGTSSRQTSDGHSLSGEADSRCWSADARRSTHRTARTVAGVGH